MTEDKTKNETKDEGKDRTKNGKKDGIKSQTKDEKKDRTKNRAKDGTTNRNKNKTRNGNKNETQTKTQGRARERIPKVSNRELKSDVFTALFSEPENAAKLYTALSGEKTAPEDIRITTLEGVLFLARKNDLGFTVKERMLVISEHQSTINENMPLRSILYYGRTMEKLLQDRNLYREKRVPIPTPEFYLFYNGTRDVPGEKVLKLSDGYIVKTKDPMLELKVKMININLPAGHRLLRDCVPLYEYSWFIERVRTYIKEGEDRDSAVTLAVKDSVREGIFSDFVTKHGSEVENMLFTQFNMDDALEVRYEEGVEDGMERGLEQGRKQGLKRGMAKGLEQGLERGLTQGLAQGLEQGRTQGERRLLIHQVWGKLQKGEKPEKIAEDLLADEAQIRRICEAIAVCGPEEADISRWLEEHFD